MWYKDIYAFKDDNGYEIDGIWYPRVTSIVSIKAKPALYAFYAGLPDFKTGEDIKSKSAEEGTLIHETVEALLRKEDITVPELIKPAVAAFNNFYSNHLIVPLKIEERVISKKHHYAGTMDVLAEIDGRLGVLDIKTSVAIYRDYNIQTSAYIEALREDPNMPPLTRWILRLNQQQKCLKCPATLRTKGGREKIRGDKKVKCEHEWSEVQGECEFKELVAFKEDIKAFLACKDLWNWENKYWVDQLLREPPSFI
jgi:hypothetical protein